MSRKSGQNILFGLFGWHSNFATRIKSLAKSRAVSMTTNIIIRIQLLIWVSSFCLSIPALTASAQVFESGFVLLTNDRCLDGRIELVADRCVITKLEGNQVTIPRSQVQYVASSKQELYRFKCRTLSPRSRAGDHFKLAKWCLSMQLLSEAGQHYLTLIESYPPQTNSSVKRLGVEIKDAMLQQPEFRSHLGLAPLNPVGSHVAQTPSGGASAVVPASTATVSLAEQLPMQVKSLFVDRVQPILLNRCGQASCHGPASGNPLQLESAVGSDAARRSQGNMESLLRYISQNAQSRSILMQYATKPHGKRNVAPISARETHLSEEIDRWLHFAQNQVVTAEANSLAQPTGLRPVLPGSAEYRQVPDQALGVPRASIASAGYADPGSVPVHFPVGADVPTVDELDQLDQWVTEQTGVPPLAVETNSQDPFDPAEFNRLKAAER